MNGIDGVVEASCIIKGKKSKSQNVILKPPEGLVVNNTRT